MMNLNKKIDAFDLVFIAVKAIILCGLAFVNPWLIIPVFIAGELMINLKETKKEESIPFPYNTEIVVQETQNKKGENKVNSPKTPKKMGKVNNQDKPPKTRTRRIKQN